MYFLTQTHISTDIKVRLEHIYEHVHLAFNHKNNRKVTQISMRPVESEEVGRVFVEATIKRLNSPVFSRQHGPVVGEAEASCIDYNI